jgi:hypothetical protein
MDNSLKKIKDFFGEMSSVCQFLEAYSSTDNNNNDNNNNNIDNNNIDNDDKFSELCGDMCLLFADENLSKFFFFFFGEIIYLINFKLIIIIIIIIINI